MILNNPRQEPWLCQVGDGHHADALPSSRRMVSRKLPILTDIAMTVAIGYDWIYDALSNDDRTYIAAAINNKDLVLSINAPGTSVWKKHTNNWAQLTGATLTIAALVVKDVYEKNADDIIAYCIKKMKMSLEQYGPDGGWVEGYSYGTFANYFMVLMLRSAETALPIGNEVTELTKLPGMDRLGRWLTHHYGQTAAFSCGDGTSVFKNADRFWSIRYWAQTEKPKAWMQALISTYTSTQLGTFQALILYDSDLADGDVLKDFPRHG